MTMNDEMSWTNDFNPLQWAMGLLLSAKKSKSGRATREFLFDAPLNQTQLYHYHVVWHYFMKCTDTKDKRIVMIMIRDDNVHLYGMCDMNGIPDEVYQKYAKSETNED